MQASQPPEGAMRALRARASRCLAARSNNHLLRGRAVRAAAGVAGEAGSEEVQGQYPFRAVEERWQQYWEAHGTFRTPVDVDTSKPKFYALDMFPYPRLASCAVSPLPALTLCPAAPAFTWGTLRATLRQTSWRALRHAWPGGPFYQT